MNKTSTYSLPKLVQDYFPLDAWRKLYPLSASEMPFKTLGGVLKEFNDFQTEFFKHFEKKDEWLTHRIQQALQDYWMPVARVAEQYAAPPYKDVMLAKDAQSLIQEYQRKFEELFKAKLPDLLVYFDKAAVVRRYPFTDVMFVAMPYRLVLGNNAYYWLAIPHEIGHHLFWNLDKFNGSEQGEPLLRYMDEQKSLVKTIREHLANELSGIDHKESVIETLLSWLEETFADIVATRIAGQAYLKATKVLVRQQAKEVGELTTNDGDHAPPCMRPYIIHLTLQHMGENSDDWLDFISHYNLNSESEMFELSFPVFVHSQGHRGVFDRLKDVFVGGPNEEGNLKLKEVRAGFEMLVEQINLTLDKLIENGYRPPMPDSKSRFERHLMLAIARSEEYKREIAHEGALAFRPKVLENVNELLLNPVILESGFEYHTHSISETVHGDYHSTSYSHYHYT